MLLLWLLLGAALLLLVYMEVKFFIDQYFVIRLGGPLTLPIVGNAHQLGKKINEVLENIFRFWYLNNQSNTYVRVGFKPYIFLTEPGDVEALLTSQELIHKSSDYDLMQSWLGDGLLTSSGSKWHKHRKMITPAFHFKILQNFHQTMNAKSTKFTTILEKASAGGGIFDVDKLVSNLTLDVICETAMGVEINALDDNETEFAKALQTICRTFYLRFFHAWKNNESLYRFAPEYKEYCKTLATLRKFTMAVIEKRIKERESLTHSAGSGDNKADDDLYGSRKMAFLDTLLTSTIDNRELTLDEIYDEVSTFIFEGHDTTASGIGFGIYALSRHKEVQEKVFAEQQAIMGGDLSREATYNEIAEMKYLDLFIKEVERVYPSVPMIVRRAHKDTKLSDVLKVSYKKLHLTSISSTDNISLPKGLSVAVFLIGMGYCERHFEDPYRFKPERFDSNNEKTGVNAFLNLPFSAGPRNCIGQKFALLELKTVLSKIVRQFEILPPTDELYSRNGYVQHYWGISEKERNTILSNPSPYDPLLSSALTLKSENGIQIRLRKRVQ